MNTNDLKKELDNRGIAEQIYELPGMVNELDCFVLEKLHGKWLVYYRDERGGINDLQEYLFEDQACNNFINTIDKLTYDAKYQWYWDKYGK